MQLENEGQLSTAPSCSLDCSGSSDMTATGGESA